MITLITHFVNYKYSTSICKEGTFVRMVAQAKENKGVELTDGGGNVNWTATGGIDGVGRCETKKAQSGEVDS